MMHQHKTVDSRLMGPLIIKCFTRFYSSAIRIYPGTETGHLTYYAVLHNRGFSAHQRTWLQKRNSSNDRISFSFSDFGVVFPVIDAREAKKYCNGDWDLRGRKWIDELFLRLPRWKDFCCFETKEELLRVFFSRQGSDVRIFASATWLLNCRSLLLQMTLSLILAPIFD